jgi:hypothetical protein
MSVVVALASLACGTAEFEPCAPLRDDIEHPWANPQGDPGGPRIVSGSVFWTGEWGDGCEADFDLEISYLAGSQSITEITVWSEYHDNESPNAEALSELDLPPGAGAVRGRMCMRNMTENLNQSFLLFIRDSRGQGSNVHCATMQGTPPSGATP